MEKKIPIGQGDGIPGRYAGLPDPYGMESFSKIVILPVPFDKTTTYQKGSDRGPDALIEASRHMELYDVETQSEVYKKGIFTAKAVNIDTSEVMLDSLHQRTKELLAQDKYVVTIGGEHSISFASIRAHAEHYGALTILQLDAHADLLDTYENDPWSHACVMARVKELSQVKHIVSVGIRSMSAEEVINVDPQNTFFAHTLSGKWIDRVLDRLTGPVYITFDLDVFDPSLMPSTGTPEPGGMFWNEVISLLRRAMKEKNIVGFDIVELCPRACNAAPDYIAAKLIYKLLSYKFETS